MIGVPPNRERFLAAIAERISADRVQALYLFPPIRQGPVETGIAVIAVSALAAAPVETEPAAGETEPSDLAAPEGIATLAEPSAAAAPARPVVLTARYRHVLKGADRGKWELEVLEQADAPLVTLEKVIQGVLQRLDDSTEPERLGADALRAALADGVWATPQR
jgi:hypothetical protein